MNLTKEEKDQMQVYKNRWHEKALSTKQATQVECEEYASRLYKKVLEKPLPEYILLLDSPLSASFMALMFFIYYNLDELSVDCKADIIKKKFYEFEITIKDDVYEEIFKKIQKYILAANDKNNLANIRQGMYHSQSNLKDVIFHHIKERNKKYIENGECLKNIKEYIFANYIGSAFDILDKIFDNINRINGIESIFLKPAFPYLWGQYDCDYFAWTSFLRDIVKVKGLDTEIYDIYEDSHKFGPIWATDKFCVFSNTMEEIYIRDDKLHKDCGPAIKYRDGFAIYALNGIVVPQWLAMQRDVDIDVRKFAKLDNIEVRREFVRKIGIERMVYKLGAESLDKWENYELLLVDLKGRAGKWPYLKMLNPSTGLWHLECVDKDCKTVKDAIFWRNQINNLPQQLT